MTPSIEELWERERKRERRIQKNRDLENLRQWPRSVKAVFYTVVKGLNQFDRERVGRLSPLNGRIAAEVAWSEYDRGVKS